VLQLVFIHLLFRGSGNEVDTLQIYWNPESWISTLQARFSLFLHSFHLSINKNQNYSGIGFCWAFLV